MKKEGYRESTIVSRVKLLARLARGAISLDPESVKEAIAGLVVTEARKENLVRVYGGFCRQNNLAFNQPRYHKIERLHFIPNGLTNWRAQCFPPITILLRVPCLCRSASASLPCTASPKSLK